MESEATSREIIERLKRGEAPEKILAGLEHEASEHEADADDSMLKAHEIRKRVAAMRVLMGISDDRRGLTTGEVPVGIEAARRVMREGGVWTVASLLNELQKRGWDSKDAEHPLKATEAAISRLHNVKKEIERVGRGKYRYKQAPGSVSLDRGSDAELSMLPRESWGSSTQGRGGESDS